MKQYKLNVTGRTDTGSGASRRLRAAGQIPAIIYGPSGNKNLTIAEKDFSNLSKQIGDSTALIEIIEDNGTGMWTIIQDIQRDAVTDKTRHIDFLEISRGKPMTATVSVHLVGEAIGHKVEGGFVEFQMHEVQIRCLPRDLPEFITLDITELQVGQGIHVGGLPELEGVTYLTDKNLTVVACIGKGGEDEEEEEETDEDEDEDEEIVE